MRAEVIGVLVAAVLILNTDFAFAPDSETPPPDGLVFKVGSTEHCGTFRHVSIDETPRPLGSRAAETSPCLEKRTVGAVGHGYR